MILFNEKKKERKEGEEKIQGGGKEKKKRRKKEAKRRGQLTRIFLKKLKEKFRVSAQEKDSLERYSNSFLLLIL